MPHIHSLTAEWLPVSIAPSDGEDLEVCVMDYDGIVLALTYACHKSGAGWVDASNEKHVDIQPTHCANGLSVINTRSSAWRLPAYGPAQHDGAGGIASQRRLQWHGM